MKLSYSCATVSLLNLMPILLKLTMPLDIVPIVAITPMTTCNCNTFMSPLTVPFIAISVYILIVEAYFVPNVHKAMVFPAIHSAFIASPVKIPPSGKMF